MACYLGDTLLIGAGPQRTAKGIKNAAAARC